MSRPPSIRTFESHEWRTYRYLRLRALEDSPDAFGSTLAEEQARPDKEWSTQLSSATASASDLPLVAEVDGEPVGLAWGRIDPSEWQTAHLYQLGVAPRARGVGAGRLLLYAVIAWARTANIRYLALDVTCGNTPATRLYTRAGFKPVGNPAPLRPASPLLEQPMRLELKTVRPNRC